MFTFIYNIYKMFSDFILMAFDLKAIDIFVVRCKTLDNLEVTVSLFKSKTTLVYKNNNFSVQEIEQAVQKDIGKFLKSI